MLKNEMDKLFNNIILNVHLAFKKLDYLCVKSMGYTVQKIYCDK